MIRLTIALLLCAGVGSAQDRVASPSGESFAHYTLCSVGNPCIPEVVISNRSGAVVRRFEVRGDEGPCRSILDVHWASESVVAAECHYNPSLSYYYEVDATRGKVLSELHGYGFVRSPDNSKVAHAGWVMHFAPPWLKSEYLQVGNTVLYPLSPERKPVDLKPLEHPPSVVTRKELVYAGVHEFRRPFVWSPDSRTVGLVDCQADYRLRDESEQAFNEGGKRENERCFVVAVDLEGTVHTKPLPTAANRDAVLRWADNRTLLAIIGSSIVKLPLQ